MPDFSNLLDRQAGNAKRPPLLPTCSLSGIVTRREFGESRERKTPFVRFFAKPTDWGADAPESWADTNTGEQASRSDIELSDKELRYEFYLTDDALFMLDEFLKSCGIEMTSDMTYRHAIEEVLGQPVMIAVSQYLNQRRNVTGNQVDSLVGTGG